MQGEYAFVIFQRDSFWAGFLRVFPYLSLDT